MIYIDSSVALADLLAEPRCPPESLWAAPLVSSRLFQYEVWNRMHAYGLGQSHREQVEAMLRKVDLVELSPMSLQRALQPFPLSVRTLDALHLATMDFLRGRGERMTLASYDGRLIAAAEALGVSLAIL